MSLSLLRRLEGRADQLRADADALLADADPDTGALSESAQTDLDRITTELQDLTPRVESLRATELARAADLKARADLAAFLPPQGGGSPGTPGTPGTPTNIGHAFTQSREFSDFAAGGGVGAGKVLEHGLALVSTSDAPLTSTTADVPSLEDTSTPLLDAIGYEPVSTGSVEWIEWPAVRPKAAAVAEEAKIPEATYAPTLRSGTLQKYAHILPITQEMMEDLPRIQSIVNTELLQGAVDKVEAAGAAALVANMDTRTASGASLLASLRNGVAVAENAKFRPDVVVLNPTDYAETDLDLLERTLLGAHRTNELWGLKVIPVPDVTAGTAYVGNFKRGMKMFDRRVVQVWMTDSAVSDTGEDDFSHDILRIKARVRALVRVVRPGAIVKCTVTP